MRAELEPLLQELDHVRQASPYLSALIASFLGLSFLVLLWRLWAFTLHPMLRPSEPQELPYWIPILGHAFGFIKDSQGLLDRGREYFKNSGKPFALTVGGQKLYVLLSPDDVGAVYRNNTTLSWDAMLNDLLISFGVEASVIPKLWAKPTTAVLESKSAESKLKPSKPLSAIHATLDLYKTQLLPGPRLDSMSDTLLGHINALLDKKSVRAQFGPSTMSVSLKDFCSRILVDALTRTLFGSGIYDVEPNMVRYLLDFNEDAWMLVFQYPQSARRKLNTARDMILNGFVAYMQSSPTVQSGQAWLITNVLEQQESLDIRDEDRAALLLMIYWAANINPYRLAFWMLAYILFDPKLHAALCEETSVAFQNDQVDVPYLVDKCPRLDAAYLEVLRIVNTALSARKIIAPTPIGDQVLSSGNTILIPFRQLHQNRKVFGDDPGRFDPERFLHDPDLKKSSSYKPFGGGVNYCPGRFLAKQEMLVFVALVINRFDLKVATVTPQGVALPQAQAFPNLDLSTPALGVNGPVKGSDVFVDLGTFE